MATLPSGTIDITDLVSQLKDTWVSWARDYVFAAALTVPWLQWIAWPVISTVVKFVIEKGARLIADTAEMYSFFLNTALKKASQAKDFTDAVHAKNNLPPEASDEEYEKAEAKQMLAFRNLVLLSN